MVNMYDSLYLLLSRNILSGGHGAVWSLFNTQRNINSFGSWNHIFLFGFIRWLRDKQRTRMQWYNFKSPI